MAQQSKALCPGRDEARPLRTSNRKTMPAWFREMRTFEAPSLKRALWQILDTFVPYLALWIFMVILFRIGAPYWTILLLSILAAGLQIRIFILFHDCCHGSFFASRRANVTLGTIAGVLTCTPYKGWRSEHNAHHATSSDLDRRGIGDITTLTVAEYRSAPWWKRMAYRAYRNPLILFILGPVWVFLIRFRFFPKKAGRPERLSVLTTDLAPVSIVALAAWTIGLKTFLAVQLPTFMIGAAAGVWLFYIQHQFEKDYWARHETWDPLRASLEGSSYYKLPKVLQWFTGNIGLHHVHHARPRIPNYNLQRCHDHFAALGKVRPLTLWTSMKSLRLHLWDEETQRMVGFGALRGMVAHTA